MITEIIEPFAADPRSYVGRVAFPFIRLACEIVTCPGLADITFRSICEREWLAGRASLERDGRDWAGQVTVYWFRWWVRVGPADRGAVLLTLSPAA